VSVITIGIAHISYKLLEEPYFKGKQHEPISYSKLPPDTI
jgi:hypothetical protein